MPTWSTDPGTGRQYDCTPSAPILHFTDVAATAQYCRHAHYLWSRAIIDGCSASTYCPTLTVSRGQMSKFLVNGFGLTLY